MNSVSAHKVESLIQNAKIEDGRDIHLCVDLDGTLINSDLLFEAALLLLRERPLYIFILPIWLLKGKAHLKRELALRVSIDPATLPYDKRTLEIIKRARANGTTCALVTASDQTQAESISAYLGHFDKVIGSNGVTNLSGKKKAAKLVSLYGNRGFDYVANHRVDLAIWKHARRAWVINGPRILAERVSRLSDLAEHHPAQRASIITWLRAVRVHQWLKNLLILVPLFAAHQFSINTALQALAAFIAFSLCASGVYVFNDLLDLNADRLHPRKKLRPFAAGNLKIVHGLAAAPLLTLAGFAVTWWCVPALLPILGLYYLATLAYSLRLKQIHMLDVMLLASLYTIRIIGGAVAIDVPLSFWLLAFSMFVFLSLAMLKRYTELFGLMSEGRNQISGRGYTSEDLTLLQALGGASGYLSVLVLALYINSPESLALYSRPELLWLLCPLLLYWISRAWSLVQRGRMHDDPLVFSLTDQVSLFIGTAFVFILMAAI